MIKYEGTYTFTNDLGKWRIDAKTHEHPTGYGNGTLLRLVQEEYPEGYGAPPIMFDIRYENVGDADGVDMLVREVINGRYGVLI